MGKLEADLTECRRLLGHEVEIGDGPLPVGVGFITSHPSVGRFEETVLPIIAKHRPAAVWLFAPDEELKPHEAMIRALRSLDSPPCVFVQVGNVKAAREAVRDGADAIVCQGIDAGGHQFRRGAGVISLVPEVRQMLDQEQESWQHEHAEEPSRHLPPRELAVFAAGGIADGKGVAAMMALGEYRVADANCGVPMAANRWPRGHSPSVRGRRSGDGHQGQHPPNHGGNISTWWPNSTSLRTSELSGL